MSDQPLLVGHVLFGYCDGLFGDSYGDKRIEAVGADWVIAREEDSGRVVCATGHDVRTVLIEHCAAYS